MTDSDCVFCKIVNGQIPCTKVYEDDQAMAFLDIGPLADGHLLMIPKVHVASIYDMTPEHAAAMGRLMPQLARCVQSVTDAGGLNILQNNGQCAGQAVFHVHFHFIPRVDGDGLGYRWNAGTYTEGRADAIAQQMRSFLAERQ